MTADNAKKIGQRINTAIAKSNKLQKDLAAHLGVKDNVISYFCSGTRTPNIEQITRISEFLDVSCDYLLGTSDVSSTNADVKAVCDYTGLSERAAKILEQMNNHPDLGGDPDVIYALDCIISAIPMNCNDGHGVEDGYALVSFSEFMNFHPPLKTDFSDEYLKRCNIDPDKAAHIAGEAIEQQIMQDIYNSLKDIRNKYYK